MIWGERLLKFINFPLLKRPEGRGFCSRLVQSGVSVVRWSYRVWSRWLLSADSKRRYILAVSGPADILNINTARTQGRADCCLLMTLPRKVTVERYYLAILRTFFIRVEVPYRNDPSRAPSHTLLHSPARRCPQNKTPKCNNEDWMSLSLLDAAQKSSKRDCLRSLSAKMNAAVDDTRIFVVVVTFNSLHWQISSCVTPHVQSFRSLNKFTDNKINYDW